MNDMPLWQTICLAYSSGLLLALLWPPFRLPAARLWAVESDYMGPAPINLARSVLFYLLKAAVLFLLWPLLLLISCFPERDALNALNEQLAKRQAKPWSDDQIVSFVEDFSRAHPQGIARDEGQFWNETLLRVFEEVPIQSRDAVSSHLAQRGIGMTGAATLNPGSLSSTPLILPFHLAVEVRGPISLWRGKILKDDEDAADETSGEKYGPDDWNYMASRVYPDGSESWQHPAESYGMAKIRDGWVVSLRDIL